MCEDVTMILSRLEETRREKNGKFGDILRDFQKEERLEISHCFELPC